MEDDVDPDYLDVVKTVVSWYDKRTSSLLPDSHDSILHLHKAGPAANTVTTRTIEWVKEHGRCIDSIHAQKSTLPHAGRGAFAKRLIRKGETVVPVPFLHIYNKDTFNIYPVIKHHDNKLERSTKEKLIKKKIIGKQLFLNYCFGHDDSMLLLCPTTHAALINHKSLRQAEKDEECNDGPNAHYRWADDALTKEWLNLSLNELKGKTGRGLTMDIIATRDIMPGEEIFIDYGMEWEKAWNEHVAKWKPKNTSSMPLQELIHSMNREKNLRTVYDLIGNPYPENITTVCLYFEPSEDAEYEKYDYGYEPEDIILMEDLMEILGGYSINGEKYDVKEEEVFDHYFWPCSVYEISDNIEDPVVTVQIFQLPAEKRTPWTEAGIPRFVVNYPKDKVMFAETPYSGDQFRSNVFRHPIGMSDDVFPMKWRDLAIELFGDGEEGEDGYEEEVEEQEDYEENEEEEKW